MHWWFFTGFKVCWSILGFFSRWAYLPAFLFKKPWQNLGSWANSSCLSKFLANGIGFSRFSNSFLRGSNPEGTRGIGIALQVFDRLEDWSAAAGWLKVASCWTSNCWNSNCVLISPCNSWICFDVCYWSNCRVTISICIFNGLWLCGIKVDVVVCKWMVGLGGETNLKNWTCFAEPVMRSVLCTVGLGWWGGVCIAAVLFGTLCDSGNHCWKPCIFFAGISSLWVKSLLSWNSVSLIWDSSSAASASSKVKRRSKLVSALSLFICFLEGTLKLIPGFFKYCYHHHHGKCHLCHRTTYFSMVNNSFSLFKANAPDITELVNRCSINSIHIYPREKNRTGKYL